MIRRLRTLSVRLVLLSLLVFSICWVAIPFAPQSLEAFPEDTVLLDRTGDPLRVRLGEKEVDCRPVGLGEVSEWVPMALVASEDKRFYRHPGVDPIAITRALALNLIHRRRVSGASTVSTQVIRLAEPRPRNVATKVLEGIKALKMERTWGKEAILEQHLNRAPFGGNLTGVESASQTYFKKSAADLSVGEASLLLGLIQAPSRFRPDRYPEAASRRQTYVLEKMACAGMIDPDDIERIQRDTRIAEVTERPFRAPHFCDLLLSRGQQPGPVSTTLDPDLQQAIEGLVESRKDGWREAGVDGLGVVLLEVKTGAVRAMIGSPDYFDQARAGQVNGAVASRSPGSALKPFAFAMAFDAGWATPESKVQDTRMTMRDFDPSNFHEGFDGEISCRDALVKSLNIPALRVTRKLGVPDFLERLRDLGLRSLNRSPEHYGLSVVLGSGEVRLLDLTNAYACFARGGRYRPYALREDETVPVGREIFSPEAAYMISDILSGEDRSMDLFGHMADAPLVRFAWKTGTSSGFRDAWTIAYNPEYVLGVWFGNPNGRSSPALVGAGTAAPLAADIFRLLYPEGDGPWFPVPNGIRLKDLEDGATDLYIAGVTRPDCWKKADPSINEGPQIVSPFPGSVYQKLEGFHAQQSISLQVKDPKKTLYWFVNEELYATTKPGEVLEWPVQQGAWTFVCSDAEGRMDLAQVVVE